MSLTRTIKTAARPANGRTTFHRDGTVTYWNIFEQAWCRALAHDVVAASLMPAERARVERLSARTAAEASAAELARFDTFDQY